jgi:superfamily II DNA or RNA helicase
MQAITKHFRPYQSAASDAILEYWKKFKSTMCVVATGGGKTMIAAGTAAKIHKTGGRVLFLANRNELCSQPLGVFREQCDTVPGLEKADSYADLDASVVIGSVQTLSRKSRLERFPQDHFSFIFADEAHGAIAASWKRIFSHFPQARICGITATPFRADNKSLADIFESEAYRMGLFQLVDEGYLVSPDHVDKLSTAVSLANVRIKHTTEGQDYDLNDSASAIAPYLEEIAKELKERHSDRHILAFLPLVYSSEQFVAACRKVGINAVHVDGEDKEREQKLQAFKDGRIQLLSNSNLLHTGIDFPICDATLNLRPTRSRVLYQQIVGRSTRTVPGLIDGIDSVQGRLDAIARSAKPRAYIIDPLWLSFDHNLVTPSFLVAKDQEDAEEIEKRATKSYSLRGLNRQVIAEREEAMRRLFERAASFRAGRVSYEYFRACSGDYELQCYVPVYPRELRPPSEDVKRYLAKMGIDPDTVKTDGEATAIRHAIGRRRYRRLAEIRSLGAAVEKQTPDMWKLTEVEARRIS